VPSPKSRLEPLTPHQNDTFAYLSTPPLFLSDFLTAAGMPQHPRPRAASSSSGFFFLFLSDTCGHTSVPSPKSRLEPLKEFPKAQMPLPEMLMEESSRMQTPVMHRML